MAAVWSFVERVSTQIVSFFIGIVLARILSAHDYGIVGLTSIFIAFSNIFIDSGFANALIRKKDRTQEDLSTAFYFNFIVGTGVYLVLFAVSPFIASFFNEPMLRQVVPIIGINVFLNSLCIVQTAILTSQLKIKEQAVYNAVSVTISGLVAILLAYNGLGVYALAAQAVLTSLIKMVLLWFFSNWRPTRCFKRKSFAYLWGYGAKLLGAKMLAGVFNEVYSVLIGKLIGIVELGYFSKSSSLSAQVNGVTTGIVQKVSLPILARYQDNSAELVERYYHILRLLVMVIAPLSAFLCIAGNDIIVFLWTDKWTESILLFQLLIVSTMFEPIGQLSLSLFEVQGRTDMILRIELPKKLIYAILIGVGFMNGVKGLCIAKILISATEGIVNICYTPRILPISIYLQFTSVLKYMVVAFPLPFVISSFIYTDSFVLNICIKLLILLFLYCGSLYLIRDKTYCSIQKKIIQKFRN